MAEKQYIWGTGRRKTSIARVRLKKGDGKIMVNNLDLDAYFPIERDRGIVMSPLKTTNRLGEFDVLINVQGGGITGQAGAISLGIARALSKSDSSLVDNLRNEGFLTRDSRMKERKKYGQKGARKSFQWTKR
ncbi:MAG: 30S ribosomal protein S9 [Candidatus Jettenia sp.]|uniref:Small ribosomal subunit protein uS9 n=1 Tax=Candidatus Jettenia caeni TaxID=247490 RepID=I3INH9_9BACT|nr:30S ribosomal protein S9 [Candidatus Jettenia sp. AMX1]MBC6927904.1 30S ribosomal protein S9 [Candidatus Jettenia sp.]NUN21869.1 30S ribosomal protein S9 [Candidatus Jettenia caeni]KAA0248226.1 MAG: 30S ribosomal protein S9 [Candidatus Jettenia sp. AMX1]MCE7879507.1 30S ribosomal protein S9 [Candidatus Jettenia sp. AMX1]MDL1937868.1 30S ribosomal protein S9 [Candidatus Jettenia sp. AMX1]